MARLFFEVIMGKFLLVLIGLFFVEIWVLIKVGSSIGALTTLILMVLAAMLGGQLVRSQGVMTLFNLQKRMQAGGRAGGDDFRASGWRWRASCSSSPALSAIFSVCCCCKRRSAVA